MKRKFEFVTHSAKYEAPDEATIQFWRENIAIDLKNRSNVFNIESIF